MTTGPQASYETIPVPAFLDKDPRFQQLDRERSKVWRLLERIAKAVAEYGRAATDLWSESVWCLVTRVRIDIFRRYIGEARVRGLMEADSYRLIPPPMNDAIRSPAPPESAPRKHYPSDEKYNAKRAEERKKVEAIPPAESGGIPLTSAGADSSSSSSSSLESSVYTQNNSSSSSSSREETGKEKPNVGKVSGQLVMEEIRKACDADLAQAIAIRTKDSPEPIDSDAALLLLADDRDSSLKALLATMNAEKKIENAAGFYNTCRRNPKTFVPKFVHASIVQLCFPMLLMTAHVERAGAIAPHVEKPKTAKAPERKRGAHTNETGLPVSTSRRRTTFDAPCRERSLSAPIQAKAPTFPGNGTFLNSAMTEEKYQSGVDVMNAVLKKNGIVKLGTPPEEQIKPAALRGSTTQSGMSSLGDITEQTFAAQELRRQAGGKA